MTKNGFKIKIDSAQTKDFVFSWHAFGAKNGFLTPVVNTPVVPTCQLPQILVDNICKDPLQVTDTPTCNSPQVLVNNICIDPPPPETPLPVTSVPVVPTCQLPQILIDNVCTDPSPPEAPPSTNPASEPNISTP